MRDDQAAYLARREAQERRLATNAADPAARRIHLDLAERYAARQREMVPLAAA